jgi:hypothetical protein
VGRRGRARGAGAGRRAGDPRRIPHVARDGGAARARRRRLDARGRLEPDAARPDDEPPPRPGEGTLEDLLADVDDGILLATNKSWSIDDKRLNFQFGTEIAWKIERGRRGRMLRDATYTGTTPVFWGSLDGVAGPEEWRLTGLTNCGKGQPGQHAHVSHGASPTRFRNVQVGVRS